MSRIRSIHPDLFTDEAFVEISFAARILLLGLGTEADDQGIFQWKPTGIRLKIFPGDAVDVQDLLKELVAVDFVRRYRADDGREFGAIRNFCRHQKPKRPNAKFPVPDDLHEFISLHENSALAPESSPRVGNSSGIRSPGEERRGEERRGEEGKGEELPACIPPDTFHEFLEHRRKRDGKRMTDYARSRLISKLERLADEGHPAKAVMEQSMENNWAGVFEIKGAGNGNGNNGGSNGLLNACTE